MSPVVNAFYSATSARGRRELLFVMHTDCRELMFSLLQQAGMMSGDFTVLQGTKCSDVLADKVLNTEPIRKDFDSAIH